MLEGWNLCFFLVDDTCLHFAWESLRLGKQAVGPLVISWDKDASGAGQRWGRVNYGARELSVLCLPGIIFWLEVIVVPECAFPQLLRLCIQPQHWRN